MLVRAAKEDPDRGEGYARRIYSLGVVSLLVITVVATALSGPIVDLYGGNITDAGEHHAMVLFAYFFIPQIFFYGMDSLLGAILNVRGRFGANMWTPVINNVVVIVVALLYMATVHDINADTVSSFGRHVARRVQHARDLRLPPCGDLGDRPDVRVDVRLRRDPMARQPGRPARGELRG
jgi:peptidoglycan biosynthesis protein MviN/MurJ (putative lipid II flippase)